jgi:hypothetical protein
MGNCVFRFEAMDANEAARELRRTLQAPSSALSVSVWQQEGKTSLMVWIDPRYAGQVKIPNDFEGYRGRHPAQVAN